MWNFNKDFLKTDYSFSNSSQILFILLKPNVIRRLVINLTKISFSFIFWHKGKMNVFYNLATHHQKKNSHHCKLHFFVQTSPRQKIINFHQNNCMNSSPCWQMKKYFCACRSAMKNSINLFVLSGS